MRLKNPDSRFTVSGGKGGTIAFADRGRKGELSWEYLVGSVLAVIYGSECKWLDNGENISRGELTRLVQDLANDSGARIAVRLSDREFVLSPIEPA